MKLRYVFCRGTRIKALRRFWEVARFRNWHLNFDSILLILHLKKFQYLQIPRTLYIVEEHNEISNERLNLDGSCNTELI